MTKSRKKVSQTVKKFKVKLSLEKKYIGENIPVMLRQDDMGTIIEAQIFTEDNNCYDLTGNTVTFTIQGAGSIPVLNESCTVIDSKNGIVQHAITDKDSKHAGKVQHAFFQIKNSAGTVIESTGDIDIRILEMPRILPSDYIKEESNFQGKVRGDWSNPNTMNMGYISVDKNGAYCSLTEWDQEIYNTTDPNIYARTIYPVGDQYVSNIICLKIKPQAEKVVLRNLYLEKKWGTNVLNDIRIVNLRHLLKVGPERAKNPNNTTRYIENDVVLNGEIEYTPITKPGITVLKYNEAYTRLPQEIEIDMKLNQDLLSADNYLVIKIKFRDIGVSMYNYDISKISQYPLIKDPPRGQYYSGELLFFPQITCTQYYLPD